MLEKWGSMALGGFAGTAARYLLAGVVYRTTGTGFPYGTLVVNLAGCLLVGLLNSLAEARFLLGPTGRMLLMTGFCGAFTTFSTLILETSNLVATGEWLRAFVNSMGSVVLGFILFRIGAYLGTII